MYSSEGKTLFDALVTSYECVQLDKGVLKKINWSTIVSKFFWVVAVMSLSGSKLSHSLVCMLNTSVAAHHLPSISVDEAHRIKNLYCKLASCLKRYSSEFRLLLTVSIQYPMRIFCRIREINSLLHLCCFLMLHPSLFIVPYFHLHFYVAPITV
jgi:SNF2 family DNA or RNA helicase